MKYEDEYDAILGGRKLARKGISISTKRVISTGQGPHPGEKRRGRPRSNIFIKSPLYPAVTEERAASPSSRRARLLVQHQLWVDKFAKSARTSQLSPGDQFMPSIVFKDREDPIWTVYYAAELAWILMRHKSPENRQERPSYLKTTDTFVAETYGFWRFLNEHIERNTYKHKRKGPKPNAEKLFKTALATFVARKLIAPKGGNWRELPTPRDISQIWFVLFGEDECHDAIKKRLPRLVHYCERFPLEWGSYKNGEPTRYPVLAAPWKRSLTPLQPS